MVALLLFGAFCVVCCLLFVLRVWTVVWGCLHVCRFGIAGFVFAFV